jgi:hypothetical protein
MFTSSDSSSLSSFYCCGCNVQKKAEARVLANYQKRYPCVNDTVVSGNHSDTTVKYDTLSLSTNVTPGYHGDMYTPPGVDCCDYSYGPATPMYGDPFFPKKENIRVTKTVTIHDTSFRYIRDQRAENILDDSLRSAQFNLKVSEGEKEGWKQKAQDRFKALFIVIALFVIGLIIKFYSKNIFSGLKGFITGI